MGRDVCDRHEKLQAEIQREKAEALGRAGERLEEALRKLAELKDAIGSLGQELKDASPERRSLTQGVGVLAGEYNALREKAATYYRYLIIQREAVGIFDHREVERLYRIPDPLRPLTSRHDRGGPRRRLDGYRTAPPPAL
ncbi:MAG: hypothetical protein ACE5IQ_02855 [Candidatus Methylomirabilales bacterium]